MYLDDLQHAISLSQQLEYFKEYKDKLTKSAGSDKANSIIDGALFLVSFGPSDFVQNYYVNPYVNKVYTVDEYSNMLVKIMSDFIKVKHIPKHFTNLLHIKIVSFCTNSKLYQKRCKIY